MCASGTGLLTYAMHAGRGAGCFPSRRYALVGASGCIHTFEGVRESQLRGSGGVSPRFPNILLRDKGGG